MGQTESSPTKEFFIPNFKKICQGAHYVAGKTDWLETKSTPGIGFYLCPECYDTSVKPYGFATDEWIVAQNVSPTQQYRCQFSRWWIRVSWMRLVNEKPLQSAVMKEVFETPLDAQVCANNEVFKRQWLSLRDPETRQPIPGLTACAYCMTCLTKILPELKPHIVYASNGPSRNTCDLMPPNEMAIKIVPSLLYEILRLHNEAITMKDVLHTVKEIASANNKTIPPEEPVLAPEPAFQHASGPTATPAAVNQLTNAMSNTSISASNTAAASQPTTQPAQSPVLQQPNQNSSGSFSSQQPQARYEGIMGLANIFTDYSNSLAKPPAPAQTSSAQSAPNNQNLSGPMALAQNFQESSQQIVNRPNPTLSSNQATTSNLPAATSPQVSGSSPGCPRLDKAQIAWHFYMDANALEHVPVACCGSCFQSIIKPEIAAGKPLAKKWTEETRTAAYFCQLGSPRLRGKWVAALEQDNEALYIEFVKARTEKLISMSKQIETLASQKKVLDMQVQYYNNMSAMKMMASASSLASAGSVLGGGGHYTVNFNVSECCIRVR